MVNDVTVSFGVLNKKRNDVTVTIYEYQKKNNEEPFLLIFSRKNEKL
jgi:hypothetical protein